MKNLISKNSFAGWRTRRAFKKLILPAACLVAVSATAATEQWQGVPGTTATTNWTDSANWTSPQQTYYNEVQFTTAGTSANTSFAINNVLDATTGVAQVPIWQLDFIPLNGNYTTLINPGVTLTTGAGNGTLTVGADILNNSSPAAANAFETITLTGAGGTLNVGGNIYIGQGSTTPGDTHNVTLDLSGLDNFTDTGGNIYVAGGSLQRANGSFYLAKTNSIALGGVFQISNQNMSNSLPSVVELGIKNDIAINGNNLVVGGGGAVAGAVLKFNPAFIGGATVPAVYFHGPVSGGRISTVYIGNGNGGAQVASSGVCDFSGGNVYLVVDSMQLGQAGLGNATGTLTFDNNYVDANNVIVGNQTASGGGAGAGIVNLNANATLGSSSTLLVRQTLTLAVATGTLTPGTAGTVNLNGGSLSAQNIVNGAGNGTLNLNNGSLTLSTTAGTAAAPVSTLNTTNSTLTLTVASGATNLYVTSLKTGGTTNIINISAAPAYASYPAQVTLIKYGSLGGAGFNFGVGSLPPLYAGHLVNNLVNSSIDIVFTSGSSILTWSGNVNTNWDTTTANWLAGGIYADGQVVQFFDGATTSTINLTATLSPSSLIVSNVTQNFTFNGSGALSGPTGLTKAGAGKLTLDNSGNNNFNGSFRINAGTVQVGNNDANGNLPSGAIVNNGTLIYARSDSPTVNNTISGSGSFVQAGGNTLLLSGANTYAGNTLATNNSTLQLGSGSALGNNSGSVVVANGSTLDLNGNYLNEPLIIGGAGVGGNGALLNNGGGVYGFASQITLTADTTFAYVGRCDLDNATISTGGNPYSLTINTPSAYFEWQNVSADSALTNINFIAGSWGWKNLTPTSFGNPTGLLTLTANTTVTIWNTSIINKNVDFQGGLMVAYSANNVMSGNMTLEDGYDTFQMNGGCSLTLSNTLTGTTSATLYVSGGTGSLTLAGNSPNYLGNVYVNQGTLALNGSIGGTVTAKFNTTLAGSGSASGLVDVNGSFYPGNSGVAGTFTAGGGLTLESSAALTMDLSSSLVSSNDLIQVTGDLAMNANNISINPVNNILADGTYDLITYTGSFSGSIGTAATTYPTAYTLVLTNNTAAKKIQLLVSGTLAPSLLIWNNASSSGQWDIGSSANWSNVTTHAAASVFNTLDSVLLDDSILTTSPAGTNISIASTVVSSAITNNSSANYTLSGSGKISGSGSLVKLGTGTLSLNVLGNFTGPVTIGGGTIKTVGNNTFGSVASITIGNGGTFDFAGNAYNRTNPIIISGAGANGVGALTNSGGAFYDTVLNLVLANDTTVNENPGGRWDFAIGSSISGAHQLTFNGGGGGYGEIKTTTIAANVVGITITNGQLGLQNMNASCQNPATVFTVANNGIATIWSGGFNGSFALVPGSQLHLYSGSPYTVGSGAALSGSGAISGNSLIVGTGATISPAGASSATIGTLNVSGNVTLSGRTVLKLNGSGNNDVIQSTGVITNGGTLMLTNISGSPLAAGNSFQLFTATSFSGTFSSTNLPTLGAGLVWDLSQLNTGLVKVVAVAGPTIGSTTVSGGQLIFSGTGGTAGNSYVVLTSTNLVSANWVSVATNTFQTGGTFSVTNTISNSTPQLFYRIELVP